MTIDKTNGGVAFNEEAHVYFNVNDPGFKYDSVTTVIGKFCHEFDKDFWSLYKALERIMSPEDFKLEKSKLLSTKKINLAYFRYTYDVDELKVLALQQDVLDEWQETNRQSCERGTKIHSELEHALTDTGICDTKKYGLGGKLPVFSGDVPLTEKNGVYPEYLIHVTDGDLRLAGQIDLLIKQDNDILILDYKTNRKLEDKSFWDSKTKKNQMMKYPLGNIMDCNKMHYTLQLSTYAWMLQHNNPEFNIKLLRLIHYDHEGNVTEHDLEYRKLDVEHMVKYWAKQSAIARLQAQREPIDF